MNAMEVENKIKQFFEDNYELLRYEAGHDITNDIREFALQQVLFYWRKLHSIAERVTETEVKLALPNQVSPQGRRFNIEGVVDIVREDNETYMYDIKTHDLEYIHHNKELYEQQLNIYAHIWQGLRGNTLDHTAIISTAIPKTMRDALRSGDEKFIQSELDKWQPLVEIDLKKERINELINSFGKTVDNIENNCFQPPPLSKLKEKAAGKSSHEKFATRVCRNCDARFSCSSYREYAAQSQGKNLYNFRQFWIEALADSKQEDWMAANMDDARIEEAVNAADQLN